MKKCWFGIPKKNKEVDYDYKEHTTKSEKNVTVQKFTSYYIVYSGITPKIKNICSLKDKLGIFHSFFQLYLLFQELSSHHNNLNGAAKQVSTKGM